jgi:hypothetical protein
MVNDCLGDAGHRSSATRFFGDVYDARIRALDGDELNWWPTVVDISRVCNLCRWSDCISGINSMKNILTFASSTLVLMLSCFPAASQEVRFRVIPRPLPSTAELQVTTHPPEPLSLAAGTGVGYRPSALYKIGEGELSAGTYDPSANEVLHGAELATKAVLNVPTLMFQRAATRHDQFGDVVVAEWAINEPYGAGSIILEDTPFKSIYEIKLPDFKQPSQMDLSNLLSAALIWRQKSPNYIDALTVDVNTSAHIDSFRVEWPQRRAIDLGLTEGMDGESDQKALFINFQLEKGPLARFYAIPAFVPERFPPLTDLAKTWSFAQLRREVGRPVLAYAKGHDFSSQRDRILVANLARLGLSQDQLVDLLNDVDHTADGYRDRLSSVLGGFEDSKTPFLSPFFGPALDSYEASGRNTLEAVRTLFAAASQQCSASYEARALGTLHNGLLPEGPLTYLGVCSASPATVSALEITVMPTKQLEQEKGRVIAEIKRRARNPSQSRK